MTFKYDSTRPPSSLRRFAARAAIETVRMGLEKSGGRGPKGEPASERVIRDYVSRGVLGPTLTNSVTGERGLYGPRHLLEFLAARVLLNDGWTLNHVAERLRGMDEEALLAMLPGAQDVNPAMIMARQLRNAASRSDVSDAAPIMSMRRNLPEADMAAKRRSELPLMAQRLGGEVSARRTVTLQVGPDLQVIIDAERAERAGIAEAEEMGRAVTGALLSLSQLISEKERPS